MALELIGGKWKGLILFHLLKEKKRFGELRKLMPSISQRMLTRHLRELEQHRLVTRTVYPVVPPKVEYALTELGFSLEKVLYALRDWGRRHAQAILEGDD
jgi:DNA-binding HxlR family transcriptional regulator